MIVKAAVAPLFAQPDAESERVDEVLHGWPLEILGQVGDFWHVRTDYGYEGYAKTCHCGLDPQSPAGGQLNPTMTILNFADVVAKPDVRAEVLETLPRGAFVSEIGEACETPYSKIMLATEQMGYIRTKHLGTPPTSPTRQNLLNAAKFYLGVGYRWGGKTPLGIDCSGLVFMAYRLNCSKIWRDAHFKEGYAIQKISPKDAKMGDLVYFPGHVAMLTGQGDEIIHAAHANDEVLIEKISKNVKLKNNILYYGSIFQN